MFELEFTLITIMFFILLILIHLSFTEIKKAEKRLNKRIDYKYDEFIGD